MSYTVEQIGPEGLAQVQDALAEVLWACVQDHASVGFILPFSRGEALAFFTTTIAPAVAAGGRVLFVARDRAQGGAQVLGTVQLVVDTPANQPHRAEISKLLVHPDARRKGVARALMVAAEAEARARGKGLLTLDTRTGDTAEPLYASLGFQVAGVIPGYCRAPESDRLDGTTYMYKAL